MRALASVVALALGVELAVPPSASASPASAGTHRGELFVEGLINRQVRVSGFAFDTGMVGSTSKVRFTIGGNFYVPRYRNAWRYRVLPSSDSYAGLYHGFDETFPAPVGTSSVCLQANTRGVWDQIQCVDVIVPASEQDGQQRGRFTGGSYDHVPGQAVDISYAFTAPPADWGLYPYAGVQSWNSDNLVELAVGSGSFGTLNYYFGDYTSIGAANWGLAKVWPCWATGNLSPFPEHGSDGCTTVTPSHVLINTPAFAGQSNVNGLRQKVLAHETGHVLGLFHPLNGGCCSVMRQGNPASDGTISVNPASWDWASIDLLYR
jgi:hypothetical protein